MLYFEDFRPGQVFELGSFVLTPNEIIGFARKYDPQSFHLGDDPDGPFGGLVASGWQTASECQALLVQGLLLESQCLGSPGVESMRFLKPVRPNVVYSATLTVNQLMPSQSGKNRGRLYNMLTLNDPDGALVYKLEAIVLMATRCSR